jgi:hypothetical protein
VTLVGEPGLLARPWSMVAPRLTLTSGPVPIVSLALPVASTTMLARCFVVIEVDTTGTAGGGAQGGAGPLPLLWHDAPGTVRVPSTIVELEARASRSFVDVTDPARICGVPTLLRGRLTAAYEAPPSVMNIASVDRTFA